MPIHFAAPVLLIFHTVILTSSLYALNLVSSAFCTLFSKNNVLASTVRKLRTDHEQQADIAEHKIRDLEHSLTTLSSQLTDAQERLKEQSDYSEIAAELALLRSIEFPDEYNKTVGEGGLSTLDSPTLSEGANEKKVPLEVLLMNKNRQLQNQIAQLNATKDRMVSK